MKKLPLSIQIIFWAYILLIFIPALYIFIVGGLLWEIKGVGIEEGLVAFIPNLLLLFYFVQSYQKMRGKFKQNWNAVMTTAFFLGLIFLGIVITFFIQIGIGGIFTITNESKFEGTTNSIGMIKIIATTLLGIGTSLALIYYFVRSRRIIKSLEWSPEP